MKPEATEQSNTDHAKAYVALTAVGQSRQRDAFDYRNWQVASMIQAAFEAGMKAEQEKKRNSLERHEDKPSDYEGNDQEGTNKHDNDDADEEKNNADKRYFD